MAESIAIPVEADRRSLYGAIAPQIGALVTGETDLIANLANIAAVLKEVFGFFWVGFYLKKDDQLVLGPFQGPLACTRIDFGQGVCGHAYSTGKTTIVPDVDAFPGHIACSSSARSEIVVPIFDGAGGILGVLDVDSDKLNDFSDVDAEGLNSIVRVVEASVR
ncbi:GAF domain-containing protein [soil metagenome]